MSYNMGLHEVAWMINTDDLNLGQDHVMWLEGWDEDKKEQGQRQVKEGEMIDNNADWDTKENQQRWILVHKKKHIKVEFLSLPSPCPSPHDLLECAVVKNALSTGPTSHVVAHY